VRAVPRDGSADPGGVRADGDLPVISVNPPEEPKVGTIGPPVVDTEVAIDGAVVGEEVADLPGDVGELLVRGPQVTDGYWNRPDATAEAFTDPDRLPEDAVVAGDPPEERGGDPDDPWFRTGDIVQLRPDGYIAFRERAKQLLVLSTGKNVAPGPIEDRFAANEFVVVRVVLGDGRKFVSALIVPNFEKLAAWADTRGIDIPEDPTGICRDDRVRERIKWRSTASTRSSSRTSRSSGSGSSRRSSPRRTTFSPRR